MIDRIKFDEDTQNWFYLHPFAETTLQKCEKCGLYYKPILGHKCRSEVRMTKYEYRLFENGGGYVCKGSYRVKGERFKVLGNAEDAIVYKSEKAAKNAMDRMYGNYANILKIIIVKCEVKQ